MKEWNTLSRVVWTADGKGLFVSSYTAARGRHAAHGSPRQRSTVCGNTRAASKSTACLPPMAATWRCADWNVEGNMWMMENF